MGCACLRNKLNNLTGEIDENKEIEEEPYNDINNNNIHINKMKSDKNQKYMIILGNQPLLNKNALTMDSSNNILNRARSSPPGAKEDDEFNHIQYKQIETNVISPEEFQEFCSTHASLDDSIKVELRPSTSCENKTIYYGEWDTKHNKRHGRGIQVWPDGSKYIGYWKNNQAWGKGKLIHHDGDIYEGDWESGKPNGTGTYTHADGSKYVGEWKDDKQEGNGEETWPDGNMYKGEYKDGKKQGFGIFKWADGNIYEGNFDNNVINGKGKYIFNDKRVYEGDWVNNKIEGKGVFLWPDGRKYEGEFKNDKKDGYGEFTSFDGKKYKGEWKDGKQNGEGELFILWITSLSFFQ